MIGPEAHAQTRLPGTDTLQSSRLFATIEPTQSLLEADLLEHGHHRDYLRNQLFEQYVALPKQGSAAMPETLRHIGVELSGEELPNYLNAAGWAHAEAGLIGVDWPVAERVQSMMDAERSWQRALVNQQVIRENHLESPRQFDASDEYRLALNLAYAPLLKSIIVGNVTDSVRQQVFRDTAAIAFDAKRLLDDVTDVKGKGYDRAALIGFLHEANALLALLLLDDPRYVPIPSTARAGSGYFHREQTHDIMIVNQHWGDIKKIIPVEIKARPKLEDRRRYQALVIRGRMHLSLEGGDPRPTTEMFEAIASGAASTKDIHETERIATNIREMLRLYQQGYTEESVASQGLMKFHKKTYLSAAYPETSPFKLDGHGRPI